MSPVVLSWWSEPRAAECRRSLNVFCLAVCRGRRRREQSTRHAALVPDLFCRMRERDDASRTLLFSDDCYAPPRYATRSVHGGTCHERCSTCTNVPKAAFGRAIGRGERREESSRFVSHPSHYTLVE